MALNTGINSLDAGAPELRLEGEQQAGGPYNTGSDVKNALNVWNNMGPRDRAEFEGFLDFFRSGAWRDQIQGMKSQERDMKMASSPDMGEGPFMMEEFLQAVKDGFKGTYDEYIDQIDRSPADYLAQGGTAGTYTQRRRNQMAYGGTPGADGRRAYGIGSFFQEKIKDTIAKLITNELKNPAVLATLGGVGANYLDLAPDILFGEGATTEGWINDLLGMGGEYSTTRPSGMDAAVETMTGGGIGGAPSYQDAILRGLTGAVGGGQDDVYQDAILRGLGGTQYEEPTLLQKITDPIKKVIEQGKEVLTSDTKALDEKGQDISWKIPLTVGAGAHEYQKQYLADQPKFPMDETGYAGGVGGIQRTARITPEAEAAAKGLFFTPQDKYRLRSPEQEQAILGAAEGGRIGYGLGDLVKGLFSGEGENVLQGEGAAVAEENIYGEPEIITHGGKTYIMPAQVYPSKGTQTLHGDALERYIQKNEAMKQQFRDTPDMMPDTWISKAQGGRIGYAGGKKGKKGKGIMEILSTLEENFPGIMAAGLGIGSMGIPFLKDGGRIGLKGGKNPRDVLWSNILDPEWDIDADDLLSIMKHLKAAKDGGRIGAQAGGLMNLGGMEKDYRQEGGFVPLGGEEKADDVPARLSKNEFVFTADAVRAAGGGDVDAGAEVMENVMENLEAGGKVSEESQGLEGARNMFANAQQLEKRII